MKSKTKYIKIGLIIPFLAKVIEENEDEQILDLPRPIQKLLKNIKEVHLIWSNKKIDKILLADKKEIRK